MNGSTLRGLWSDMAGRLIMAWGHLTGDGDAVRAGRRERWLARMHRRLGSTHGGRITTRPITTAPGRGAMRPAPAYARIRRP